MVKEKQLAKTVKKISTTYKASHLMKVKNQIAMGNNMYKKIDLGGWRSDLSRIVGHTTDDETLKSVKSLKVSDTKS